MVGGGITDGDDNNNATTKDKTLNPTRMQTRTHSPSHFWFAYHFVPRFLVTRAAPRFSPSVRTIIVVEVPDRPCQFGSEPSRKRNYLRSFCVQCSRCIIGGEVSVFGIANLAAELIKPWS
jgi:hypothetical protein